MAELLDLYLLLVAGPTSSETACVYPYNFRCARHSPCTDWFCLLDPQRPSVGTQHQLLSDHSLIPWLTYSGILTHVITVSGSQPQHWFTGRAYSSRFGRIPGVEGPLLAEPV